MSPAYVDVRERTPVLQFRPRGYVWQPRPHLSLADRTGAQRAVRDAGRVRSRACADSQYLTIYKGLAFGTSTGSGPVLDVGDESGLACRWIHGGNAENFVPRQPPPESGELARRFDIALPDAADDETSAGIDLDRASGCWRRRPVRRASMTASLKSRPGARGSPP
jgi:hypothetical protein